MSGGIIYSVTRDDIRGAIELLSALASNTREELWCEGHPPQVGKTRANVATCGHGDAWYCAGVALEISDHAIWLAAAASVLVFEAWSNSDRRAEEQIRVVAPRYEVALHSAHGEAECLLRTGWLPSDYRLSRRRRDDYGEYISLVWESGNPDTYYVRGHVEKPAFVGAVRAYFCDGRMPAIGPIRHGHAIWAFSGQDDYGNWKRTLLECGGRMRGCFEITAMDAIVDRDAAPRPVRERVT